MDKTCVIFGNPVDEKTIRQAEASKAKFIKKYGDDSGRDYKLGFEPIPALDFISAQNIVQKENGESFSGKPLIVGNIRMGFGHYRISIAMASCAKAMGYEPYWMNLAGFDATGSAMIREQNDLYSTASRISQKSRLFNKIVWEPLNSEGFRQLTYNAKDQKNSELLVPLFKHIPKDIPYIATHVWPSQAAVHAGLTNVVNAIPDNWPMALHLSEGAIHAVQTPFAYFGYKTFSGFAKTPLKSMPEKDIRMVGRYVDHELLRDLPADNDRRISRAEGGSPVRLLLTVGGAGAGFDMFLAMVKHLMPYVKQKKAALFINFGDHKDVFEKLKSSISLENVHTYFNQYSELKSLVAELKSKDADGVYAICSDDIFEAVYATNLLMPECDILVTKPSELAYYPIPKVFMKHIGGHEAYGAINSSELGDAAFECPTAKTVNEMLDRMLTDKELYKHLCLRINDLAKEGYYNGAYECVKLATGENQI